MVVGPDHHHLAPLTNPELDSDWVASLRKNLKKNEYPQVVVKPDHHHPPSFTNIELDSNSVASLRKNFKKKWGSRGVGRMRPPPSNTLYEPWIGLTLGSLISQKLEKNDDLEVVVGSPSNTLYEPRTRFRFGGLTSQTFKKKSKNKIPQLESINIPWLGLYYLVVLVVSCSFLCRLPGTATDGLQLIGLASKTCGSK